MGKRRTEINRVGASNALSTESTTVTTSSEKTFFDRVK